MPPVTAADEEVPPVIEELDEKTKGKKSVVGIIYPPPEIRNIVDKTATFVARNGTDFEGRIRQNEANNPKFNFLNPSDPYHAYYQHKVSDLREGKVDDDDELGKTPIAPAKVQEALKAAEMLKEPTVILTEPPPDYEFIADPPTINALDLDVIKLTAQFVARNGRSFLSQIMNRESRNPQFDFLKPQHSMFAYFTKLVEQYTKVLIPPKDILVKLRKEANDFKHVLSTLRYRVEWERQIRRNKEREEAEMEKERVAYTQIDWHDFVVVQTVDFQSSETLNLPPPCTPKDVGARIIAQQRGKVVGGETMEIEVIDHAERDFHLSDQITSTHAMANPSAQKVNAAPIVLEPTPSQARDVPQPPALPPPTATTTTSMAPPTSQASSSHAGAGGGGKHATAQIIQPTITAQNPSDVLVRKNYDPKKAKQSDKQQKTMLSTDMKFVISPLTQERIPADKLDQHLRFNTLDQQYFDQKEREKKERESDEPVFAAGYDISSNIRGFAARRSDIFGTGAEQAAIGMKLGEDEDQGRDHGSIWDGHASSVDSTVKAASAQISIQQQIAEIHKQQGLIEAKENEGKKIGPGSMQPTSVPLAPPPVMVTNAATIIAAPMPRTAATVPLPRAMMPMVPMGMPMQQQVVLIGQPQPPQYMQAAVGLMRSQGPSVVQQLAHAQQQLGGHQHYEMSAAHAYEEEEPLAKRAKEDFLIPEKEWLNMKGTAPMELFIQLPAVADKPEWKLTGQQLRVALPLTDPISVIKAKVAEETGLPNSKQKLIYDNMFVKDSNSLAYYNMNNGCFITLQLKERGGKKR